MQDPNNPNLLALLSWQKARTRLRKRRCLDVLEAHPSPAVCFTSAQVASQHAMPALWPHPPTLLPSAGTRTESLAARAAEQLWSRARAPQQRIAARSLGARGLNGRSVARMRNRMVWTHVPHRQVQADSRSSSSSSSNSQMAVGRRVVRAPEGTPQGQNNPALTRTSSQACIARSKYSLHSKVAIEWSRRGSDATQFKVSVAVAAVKTCVAAASLPVVPKHHKSCMCHHPAPMGVHV